MKSRVVAALFVFLAMGLASSCGPSPLGAGHRREAPCSRVSIDLLWKDPLLYEGKLVCVSGFLGRMVAYGEATPELFGTRREADSGYSEKRLVLGLPFTLLTQARLSAHGLERLRVEGIFELESPCHKTVTPSAGTLCDPPPAMRVSRATLTFFDGVTFR